MFKSRKFKNFISFIGFLMLVIIFSIPIIQVKAAGDGPQIIDFSPSNGATNTSIVINSFGILFDRDVSLGNGYKNIKISGPEGEITCKDYNQSGPQLNISFGHGNLCPNAQYNVSIPRDAVRDGNGNSLDRDYNVTFRTGLDTQPPRYEVVFPMEGHVNFSVYNSSIGAIFSEPIFQGANFGNIVLKDSTGRLVDIDRVIDNTIKVKASCGHYVNQYNLYIKPKQQLDYGTKYYLTIPKGAIKDQAGNSTAVEGKTSFTTEKRTYLKVNKVSPANNAVGVSIDKPSFSLTLDQVFRKGSGFNNIYISDSKNNKYSCLDIEIVNGSLTVKPNHVQGLLEPQTTYTLHIPKDAFLGGGYGEFELENDYVTSFTTGNDNIGPIVCSVRPDFVSMEEGGVRPTDAGMGIYLNEFIESLNKNIYLKDGRNKRIEVKQEIFNGSIKNSCYTCGQSYYRNGSIMKITPVERLDYSTFYTLYMDAGFVKDIYGNLLAKSDEFKFSTASYRMEMPVVNRDVFGKVISSGKTLVNGSENVEGAYNIDVSKQGIASNGVDSQASGAGLIDNASNPKKILTEEEMVEYVHENRPKYVLISTGVLGAAAIGFYVFKKFLL